MHKVPRMDSGMMESLQNRPNAKTGHGEQEGHAFLQLTWECADAGGVEDRAALLDTLRRDTRAFEEGRSWR